MDAHLHVNGIPGGDRPPEGYAQKGEGQGRSSSWNKAHLRRCNAASKH
jgi:hypothetical protein